MSAESGVQQLKPGPEMDRAVCEALGIAPIGWGWGSEAYVTKKAAKEAALRYANPHYKDPIIKVWLSVSTDRTAMWLVWDALDALDFTIKIVSYRKGVHVVLYRTENGAVAWYESSGKPLAERWQPLPEALCRAALAALKVTP